MDRIIVLSVLAGLVLVGLASANAVGWLLLKYCGENFRATYIDSNGVTRKVRFHVPVGENFNDVWQEIKREKGIK